MRNNYLLRKYGITNDQYAELYRQQGGRCAVCQRSSTAFKTKLSVDHDHYSGSIRGLLCNYCNRRIVGRHRREAGADLLLRAYEYLTRNYIGWIVPPKKRKKRVKKSKRLRKLQNPLLKK